jgi:predicted GNAT superfamily acetyltransferase
MSSPVVIRPCQGFEEIEACVQMQADVWGYSDWDVIPRRVFVVSQQIGGQVFGAFDGPTMVGFAMALPGVFQGRPYLHSHMLAVNPDYRNQGIGRRLKIFQRGEALARGINHMEWTFDPLEIKNSYLNVSRLGAVVRRYAANFYGVSSSRLHGQVPTDRLYAEWWLDSDRVCSALEGKPVIVPTVEQEIVLPHQIAHWRHSPVDQVRVLSIQNSNREQFQQAFARHLAVIGFRIDGEGNGVFQLGPWQERFDSSQPLRQDLAGVHED